MRGINLHKPGLHGLLPLALSVVRLAGRLGMEVECAIALAPTRLGWCTTLNMQHEKT